MAKRVYADFFTVPQDYKANMTREAINETPDRWLDFYPHAKYVEFLKTLIGIIDGGTKPMWLTGSFGTGKSNAALVTQKLFMDDEKRVCKWFETCKEKIADHTVLEDLLKRRNEGTLVVYDYNALGMGAHEDFLVRLERGIISALKENSMITPAKANVDEIIRRIEREDKHFFEIRDSIQEELAFLTPEYKTVEQIKTAFHKGEKNTDIPTDLLGDIQKVLHKDNIYLDISVNTFRKWVSDILSVNNIKRIVYIFDEFHPFIETHKENLKTFEEVSENPEISHFYFIPVTHMDISAYFGIGNANAQKANTRFYFRKLEMPNDIAFKLAAHAIKPNHDPEIANEWEFEKNNLWQAVRGIPETYFNTADETDETYIEGKSFSDILPIHPMAAYLLKSLSEYARSNQRSIFEYLKGSADGREFQEFIRVGGPAIPGKQFLTADYLWKYFIERDDLGLNKEIIAVRSEFERIKSREFQNKPDDNDEIRVLKAALLFCLMSRLLSSGAHERLRPTITNIKLAFQGEGTIVGVENIIKNLADRHCFSVVNGTIEMFATSVGNADMQNKKEELQDKFHELLSEPTRKHLNGKKKSDISKYSAGRFDLRVSDYKHTTLTNISSATREQYSTGLNKDNGSICLWFVIAKNKDEQLLIPEKINSILTNLFDHRIMMFSFPNLTFCDNNLNLWDDYIEQYAKYMLENDENVKNQYKKSYERLENEWFERMTNISEHVRVYTSGDGQVTFNDITWVGFKETLSKYVKKTLPYCIDDLTDQTTAFSTNAIKPWAKSGITFESNGGQFKQLITSFKNQGITGEPDWFAQNPDNPIAQIRSLFDKKIANTIGKGVGLSVRKVYIELQRAPFGMKYNALSAFILGMALRYIIEKGYQWDNQQQTGALDSDTLAEIIESVVKADGQDNIKGEKLICRLSTEEKAFVSKAPVMFGIPKFESDARVEDVLKSIQTLIEKKSERVPLWILADYISTMSNPYSGIIAEALKNICLAFTISSKGKVDERINAIKEVGRFIIDNPDLIKTVSEYIQPDKFITAFQIYVDKTAPTLISLAHEAGDISHDYCQAILNKTVEAAGWLWTEIDISNEINEAVHKYRVIISLKKIIGHTAFLQYDRAVDILKKAIFETNKLPKTLILTAYPSLSLLFSSIVNNGTVNDIREGIGQNEDIIKKLFFDISKEKPVELLKQRLGEINIPNADFIEIFNDLPAGFSREENAFINDIYTLIDESAKKSVVLKIKTEWKRLSGTDTPSEWSQINKIPARFVFNNISDAADVIKAVESPEKFSAEKLAELLDELSALPPVGIIECQKRFIAETIPAKFAKFNINLSSLLDYLSKEYGNQPNNWSFKPDINKFIESQYKGTFAPQVIEKIVGTSAEELKRRLMQLAKDNPDLGLLFWE